MERMTAKRLESLRKPGRYRADQTLFLVIEPGGRSRHWVQRLVVNGKRRDLGLGAFPLTSLAEARERAYQNRRQARAGGDPLPRVSRTPTFRAAAAKVDQAGQWRGQTRANRRAALDSYAGHLMDRRVDQIGREDVIGILAPVYAEKPATGRRLRGWIRGVLAWAQAHGHVEVNVSGEMIDAALPSAPKVSEHRAALPYQELGAALAKVDGSTAGETVKAAIKFLLLTATRSGEVRGATWEEIDAREWRIPAARTKTGQPHRVPLSDACMAILRAMEPHRGRSGLVFPSSRGRVIPPSTLLKAWQAATGTDTTLHGSGRAGFRTWAGECTDSTRDIAEMCLGHIVGSDIERSYARSTLFERRRALMDQWAAYAAS